MLSDWTFEAPLDILANLKKLSPYYNYQRPTIGQLGKNLAWNRMRMELVNGSELSQPRKHTLNVKPAERVSVDVDVDAPGKWAFHCHLLYHMKVGMFRTVAVVDRPASKS